MGKNTALTLYELNTQVKDCLENQFPFPVWVVAEISELSERQHCYLELVQKEAQTNKLIAKSRATIWAYTYNMLKPYFETTTGYQFQAGIKVLLCVEVQYSELYGLSVNVKDIDPTYTLGDMERQRKEVLHRLEQEGIVEMNKMLSFPFLPKNIAVISSPKAAGYQDFVQQLKNNSQGYQFHLKLFAATMQGEYAQESIINALEAIYEYENVFDVVVLIRGGGAVADLMCFDSYDLAVHIAQFSLPVLTGIGHDKDVSVADIVAHTSLKTPTAVADFLLEQFNECATELNEVTARLSDSVQNIFEDTHNLFMRYETVFKHTLPRRIRKEREQQQYLSDKLKLVMNSRIRQSNNKVEMVKKELVTVVQEKQKTAKQTLHFIQQKIGYRVQKYLQEQSKLLSHKEKVLYLLSPEKLLERGYSITLCKGKVVKNVADLQLGDLLYTRFAKGDTLSKVTERSSKK